MYGQDPSAQYFLHFNEIIFKNHSFGSKSSSSLFLESLDLDHFNWTEIFNFFWNYSINIPKVCFLSLLILISANSWDFLNFFPARFKKKILISTDQNFYNPKKTNETIFLQGDSWGHPLSVGIYFWTVTANPFNIFYHFNDIMFKNYCSKSH